MDGQAYLNQISATVRPEKKTGASGILSSPIFKVAAVGVLLFIVIMIVGSFLGGGSVEKQATELLLNVDNTAATVSDYQNNIKSSNLRSNAASLYSILSNTSRELTDFMATEYKYKANSVDKKLIETATLHNDELSETLFEAKINGTLDRIFAHKMAYEISLIVDKESEVYSATSNAELKSMMQSSFDSLNNLYTQFDSFSETK